MTTTGYNGKYDGKGHGISVTTTGIANPSITYARTKAGPYTAVNPLFTNVCNETVWYVVAAPDYITQTNFATVVIKEYPAIEDIVAIPRYPWSGMVDLSFTIIGDTGVKYDTSFTAKDLVGGTNLVMKTIAFSGDVSLQTKNDSPLFSLHPGSYHAVWNAAADLPSNFVAERVTVVGDVKVPGYPVVQNGLLAWFPFNGDVKDYSGNENNLSGALTYSEDKNGIGNSCAYFNGNKSLSFSKSWSLKNAFTIACWAKPALSPGFDSQYLCKRLCNDGSTFCGWPCIFFPAAVSGTKNGSMGLSIGGDRVVNHIMMAGRFNAPTYKDCSILNQWHHIALSVNGNTSIVLYIDGKKVDSSTGFWCVGLAYNNFNADLLLTSAGKIGGGSTGVNAAMFYKGYIDDLCVYNRGLSAAEIGQLFDAK